MRALRHLLLFLSCCFFFQCDEGDNCPEKKDRRCRGGVLQAQVILTDEVYDCDEFWDTEISCGSRAECLEAGSREGVTRTNCYATNTKCTENMRSVCIEGEVYACPEQGSEEQKFPYPRWNPPPCYGDCIQQNAPVIKAECKNDGLYKSEE